MDGGREREGFLSCKLPLLSIGDGKDPPDRLPYWCLTGKFHSNSSRLCFWKKLKLHLDQIIKSMFGIMGFKRE